MACTRLKRAHCCHQSAPSLSRQFNPMPDLQAITERIIPSQFLPKATDNSEAIMTPAIITVVGTVMLTALAKACAYISNRRRRRIGLSKALKADIHVSIAYARQSFLNTDWNEVKLLFRENRRPLLTISSMHPEFEKSSSDLHLLKPDVVEAVIVFYGLERFFSICLTAMGTDTFLSLTLTKKNAYIEGLHSLYREIMQSGMKADKLLDS